MPQSDSSPTPLPSSFRDPDGYVFQHLGQVLRHINPSYLHTYDLLMSNGLYQALTDRNHLVPHTTVEDMPGTVIKPQQVPYISYPYEWSFSQLKSAALLTLDIQRLALKHDMSLKDASSYNVQFFGCQPKFIDTLSFEQLDPTKPWAAYKQFCEHFLGPLALMAHVDSNLNRLILVHLEGIPLETIANLLPWRTRLKYSLLVHLHLHARSQATHANDAASSQHKSSAVKMSKPMLLALVESLQKAIKGCVLNSEKTEWGDYYQATNYSATSMSAKEQIVNDWIGQHAQNHELIHDLGANTGRFSTLGASVGHYVVAHDIDRQAVEQHFNVRRSSEHNANVLPLQLDLAKPSPAIGWCLTERESFLQRIDSGFVLALALIHHLAIGNNTPLQKISDFFALFASKLIIEFVPKGDSQVDRMLSSRPDIFPNYDIESFEQAFSTHFTILKKESVGDSVRTLYLLERLG